MKGTLINAAAVIAGSLIGLFFSKHITDSIKKIILQALGLSTLLIGFSMGLKTQNPLILIFSLVLGGVIGEVLDIDKRLGQLGDFLKRRFKSRDTRFVDAFVSSFLIFCTGALTIMGTIQDGVSGDSTLLITKSMLDGSASVAFASAMGVGVLFSVIPLVIFQGVLTLGASLLKGYLTTAVVTEMSAVGGMLIVGVGINLLDIQKIKLSNLLPAVFVALALSTVF